MTMKLMAKLVLALGLVWMGSGAEAQSLRGCWNYSDGTVFSTVCLRGSGGTFNLEYAAEDPDQGLVKGACNGRVEVQTMENGRVVFTAPYQEDACRQGELVFRLARRDYDCALQGRRLMCNLVVYYDDGTVYSEASGLEYMR
jgi:hypothetical protein